DDFDAVGEGEVFLGDGAGGDAADGFAGAAAAAAARGFDPVFHLGDAELGAGLDLDFVFFVAGGGEGALAGTSAGHLGLDVGFCEGEAWWAAIDDAANGEAVGFAIAVVLKKSHPDSTVLFLYVNRPCIVIGRNQNPWLEVNHALVQRTVAPASFFTRLDQGSTSSKEKINIIRRRSGGGTVFHDLGNVNFSVICPPADFHRDKYTEMVVRATRKTNPRARINERHDIVLDPGPLLDTRDHPQLDDTHRTAFLYGEGPLVPRKVSGSAYKLTRQRALHHGTCLLSSPNISSISEYLHSPARPFLKARGVESVRSPISNIADGSNEGMKLTSSTFQHQIINAFIDMYGLKKIDASLFPESSASLTGSDSGRGCAFGTVDGDLLEIPEIAKGLQEIQSPEYLYGQTPQFILSTHPCEEDDRARPPLPNWFPRSGRVYMKIKSGVIISSKISSSERTSDTFSEQTAFDHVLKDKKVTDIDRFWDVLQHACAPGREDDTRQISAWLDLMLGKISDSTSD
ncbi:MAG: hypothetical protein Q9216_007174, partial [Gyalolechia sp. 2 TL-2023]